MNFKNKLESQIYDIAKNICGENVAIEHNKVIQIESALFPEVASFTGPPKKEIDLLTAELLRNPKIDLLISCKDFEGYKALPAHIQEWCAVVNTMNKYSKGTKYLGLLFSPSGFTSGCEAWATSHNLALIPPIKGNNISFRYETVLFMFERVLKAIMKRLKLTYADLFEAPNFYDFVYNIVSDFEGFEKKLEENGSRYKLLDSNWTSSFGELISYFIDKRIVDFISDNNNIGIICEGNLVFTINSFQIMFGTSIKFSNQLIQVPICKKNISFIDCDFEFLKKTVVNQKIRSAGDLGTHFEFGLENDINFGLYPPNTLYIIRTINPIEENEL